MAEAANENERQTSPFSKPAHAFPQVTASLVLRVYLRDDSHGGKGTAEQST